jgi:hypothetical protein
LKGNDPEEQQMDMPMTPKSTKTPTEPTTDDFGPIGAEPRPADEKGKYDRPSRPEEDFAIDEQRIRRRVTPARE